LSALRERHTGHRGASRRDPHPRAPRGFCG
jgi:hypothetical protein